MAAVEKQHWASVSFKVIVCWWNVLFIMSSRKKVYVQLYQNDYPTFTTSFEQELSIIN